MPQGSLFRSTRLLLAAALALTGAAAGAQSPTHKHYEHNDEFDAR